MSLKRGLIANYTGAAFNVVLPLLALPVYLHRLGADNWGLVAAGSTIVALLSIVEIGVGQLLIPQFSVILHDQPQRLAPLLAGMEIVYGVAAAVGALLILAMAGPLVDHWLRVAPTQRVAALRVIQLAAVVFAAQLLGALYRAALLAQERHGAYNATLSAGLILKHLGGIVVVSVTSSLTALLAWQAAVGMADTALRRTLLRRPAAEQRPAHVRADVTAALKLCRRGLMLSGAAGLSVFTTQSDRLYLAGMVGLSELGHYVVASTIATGLLQLINPISTTLMPRLARTARDAARLRATCRRLLGGAVAVIVASLAGYAWLGSWVLTMWLGPNVALQVKAPLDLLLVGTALNTLYQVGYLRWLCIECVRCITGVNVIAFVVAIAATPLMIHAYGVLGASIAFIAINAVGAVASLWPVVAGPSVAS